MGVGGNRSRPFAARPWAKSVRLSRGMFDSAALSSRAPGTGENPQRLGRVPDSAVGYDSRSRSAERLLWFGRLSNQRFVQAIESPPHRDQFR
jgi:hypothetical protein